MRSLVTPEDVRGLIEGGETFTVEFKGEEREPLSDQELVATVVCLANGEGGYLLVGVEDDGRITGRGLSLEDLLVVNKLLRERRVTTARAASLLQLDEGTTRALLNRMVDRGILEARGEARGRTYHLSAGAYRALREGVGYVRARGFEPIQQEQMVLRYVDAHGRITRREAAELCQLAPHQARVLLRRLVDRGELLLHGSRRGAHYERPP